MPEVELPKPDEIREQAADAFNRKVALITACYAVMLAITSLGGNNAMKEMLVEQQQSSNQWAYYQAKVIRENIYKVEAQELELDLKVRGKNYDSAQRADVDKLRKSFSDKAKEYGNEKKMIFDQAKSHEKKRDLSQRKDPFFDYAEVLLQIAIVLASISMLAHNRNVFFISLAFAILGAFFSYDGFAVGTKGYISVPFMEPDAEEEMTAAVSFLKSRDLACRGELSIAPSSFSAERQATAFSEAFLQDAVPSYPRIGYNPFREFDRAALASI